MATITRLGLYGGARPYFLRPGSLDSPPGPATNITRLGLYGGARPYLDRPAGPGPAVGVQITRLGLYGGPRAFYDRPVGLGPLLVDPSCDPTLMLSPVLRRILCPPLMNGG